MVKIDNLSFSYPGSTSSQLKNISLEINAGEFIAVIGHNGSGKSTLCKVINGLIPHFYGGDYQGSVTTDSLVVSESDIGELSAKVAYVFQDFENQIMRPRVLDDASFACLNFGLEDYEERGLHALRLVDLIERENDYVWELSGGQKHSLALASAAALGPDILILDEPIAQLDPAHAHAMYELLRKLNSEGKTIIVIEHHTEFIARYCNRVVLMKNGECLWNLPTEQALIRIEDLESVQVVPPRSTLVVDQLQKRKILSMQDQLPIRVEDAVRMIRNTEDLILPAKSLLQKSVDSVIKTDVAVTLEHIHHSFKTFKGDDVLLFKDLSLSVMNCERLAVIGNNGAGKSTLLKIIGGLVIPKSGSIIIHNKDFTGAKLEKFSSEVSYVFQNPEQMFVRESVAAEIEYALEQRKLPDTKSRVETLLAQFSLTDLRHRDPRLLSGGQMRRVSLAIGVALHPPILLLDEPTGSLDIATRLEMQAVLDDLDDRVGTVVIATHDMDLVGDWADRVIVVSGGTIIAEGSPADIFSSPDIMEQAGIEPPEYFRLGEQLFPRSCCLSLDTVLANFLCLNKGGI